MENDLIGAIKDLLSVLQPYSAKFFITGGLVATYYGEPRFTQDIDIVIDPEMSPSWTTEFLESLSGRFIVDEVSAKKAISERKMFQILHEETFLKIDIYLTEVVPGSFSRLKTVELLPNIQAPIPSITDAILFKLLWIKKGSHKSRRDAWFMIKRLTPVERTELFTRADEHGLADLLATIEGELLEA